MNKEELKKSKSWCTQCQTKFIWLNSKEVLKTDIKQMKKIQTSSVVWPYLKSYFSGPNIAILFKSVPTNAEFDPWDVIMENSQNDHGLLKEKKPCIHGIMMVFLHSAIPTWIKSLKHKEYSYYIACYKPSLLLWNVLKSWQEAWTGIERGNGGCCLYKGICLCLENLIPEGCGDT